MEIYNRIKNLTEDFNSYKSIIIIVKDFTNDKDECYLEFIIQLKGKNDVKEIICYNFNESNCNDYINLFFKKIKYIVNNIRNDFNNIILEKRSIYNRKSEIEKEQLDLINRDSIIKLFGINHVHHIKFGIYIAKFKLDMELEENISLGFILYSLIKYYSYHD